MPTENPPNLAMMDMVHRAFERDIMRLSNAVCADPGTSHRVAAIYRSWELFNSLLEHHHQAEDEALWPVLLSVDPGSAEVIANMEQQHGSLDKLLTKGESAMRSWENGPDEQTASDAREALDAIGELLSGHLAEEERTALPRVAEYLTAEQWQQFTRHNMRLNADIQWTMPWLAEGQPDEVRTVIWSFVPEKIRFGPALQASNSYAQMVATAFGLAEPPAVGAPEA